MGIDVSGWGSVGVLALSSVGLFLSGALLSHFRGLPPYGGFQLFLAGGLLGVITFLVMGLNYFRGNPVSWLCPVLAAVPAFSLLVIIVSVGRFPMTNFASSEARLAGKPEAEFDRIRTLITGHELRTINREDRQSFVIEAHEETRLFRFRDDFQIQLEPDGKGSRIKINSRSRDGKSDFGVNAARIASIFEALGAKEMSK